MVFQSVQRALESMEPQPERGLGEKHIDGFGTYKVLESEQCMHVRVVLCAFILNMYTCM